MPYRRWTKAEVRTLCTRYPDERAADVAAALGRPVLMIYRKAAALGLKKSAAFFADEASGRLRGQRGASTRFVKGHAPANKGLRRPGWGPGRMKQTQFKPGNNPHTWVPVGTERIRDGYRWVKVRDDLRPGRLNWMSKHQQVWEATHGPIPKDHIVRFRDGNRANFALGNLECVSRADHARTKGLQSLPPEIVKVHQLRGAIMRQINKRQPPAPKKRTGRPPKRMAA
jgi:hypothetical protein